MNNQSKVWPALAVAVLLSACAGGPAGTSQTGGGKAVSQAFTEQDWAEYRRADSLYKNRRYREALPIYQRLAEKGSSDAMYNTGIVYRDLNRDGEAIKWFERAADAGDKDAYCRLGDIQDKISNYDSARRYYQKAADAGLPCGQGALAAYYIDGLGGLRRNFRKSFELASKAAEQNYAHGTYLLALHYLNSWSVAYNPSQAASLLRRAANQGHDKARELLNSGSRN